MKIKFLVITIMSLGLGVSMSAIACIADELHGFADVRGGVRTQSDPYEKSASLSEVRLQVDMDKSVDIATVRLRSDFLYDGVPGEDDLDFEYGSGIIDLREFNVLASPFDFMDLKIGRQILTWGTGDLLFINDMFPKDWQSFFSGRDVEYLKAPSDAVFASFFPSFANIDVVYTPRFDSDRYISGDRISYWNPMTGSLAGRNAVVDPVKPDKWFKDDEVSLRISRNVAGYEMAVYGYYGFWKTPKGMDTVAMVPYFPELSVYGASMRAGVGKGLINFEAGYYDSRDDRNGDDPFVPNDEIRCLVGYERELLKDLSAGFQYYVEYMQDYDEYIAVLPEGQYPADEDRHVLTTRLTKRAMSQNLVLSLFVYYSPTDKDGYARPVISYKVSDAWLVTAGANLFKGEKDYTFFGQFENNNNIYAGVRYSY